MRVIIFVALQAQQNDDAHLMHVVYTYNLESHKVLP